MGNAMGAEDHCVSWETLHAMQHVCVTRLCKDTRSCSLQRRRGSAADPISTEDILKALENLAPLGSGLGTVTVRSSQYVRSQPVELSTDGSSILSFAEVRRVSRVGKRAEGCLVRPLARARTTHPDLKHVS